MNKADNNSVAICGIACHLIKAALPAAYLLSVGITFTMALSVGLALLEG
ncbi:MAG: hypothetical protein Q7R40_12390 [Phaeospirillum sp.]|nr:hypothetical protein [Phaeospirillum sp.]